MQRTHPRLPVSEPTPAPFPTMNGPTTPPTFADKLFNVLYNARAANNGALNKTTWLSTVNSFADLERPYAPRPKNVRVSQLSDEKWIESLISDPLFAGIDVRREYGKCAFWCKNNRCMPTRRRFTNWLNKADRTMTNAGAGADERKAIIEEQTQAPPLNWRTFMEAKIRDWKAENGPEYDAPGMSAFQKNDFFGMPKSWRDECWKAARDKPDEPEEPALL